MEERKPVGSPTPATDGQGKEPTPEATEEADAEAPAPIAAGNGCSSQEGNGMAGARAKRVTAYASSYASSHAPQRAQTKCGQCDGCANFKRGTSVNCGECHFCRDLPANGGPGKMKKMCEIRFCEAHPNSRKRRLEREAEAEDDEQPATDDTMVPEEPICELCE